MLVSHAHDHVSRPMAPVTRPLAARARRKPRRSLTFGFAGRRFCLHLFCLLLVWFAAAGPLADLSNIGTRAEVRSAVERHALYLAALAEAQSPGGWTVPQFPLTIAEANQTAPVSGLPSAPVALTEPTPAASEQSVAAVSAAASAPPPPPATLSPAGEAARGALEARFSMLPESFGVVVLDSNGAPIFQRRSDELFQAASLYKLGVAAEVYRQERADVISFNDPMVISSASLVDGDTMFVADDIGRKITVGEALDFMITRSSNVAAILLTNRVGSDNVNAMFGELGMADTQLLERPFRNIYGNARNQTSPHDIAHFFNLLLHGKVVDNASSQALIKLLLRQKINDRIPAALPEDVLAAHKTGNLVGAVHDAGIIYTPAPIIVVALSQDVASEAEAVQTIQDLARVAYEAYSGASQDTRDLVQAR